eukprot:TRINITY_DN147_c0_g1_i2.p2 TRINITY_DN147_c0_g1~~TRINITY_DN147_c0_g1_i2.p2  ORF type:complete len:710 (+),score=299.28 TRINITY_DN147_c0_g1_i2:95-2131(+)
MIDVVEPLKAAPSSCAHGCDDWTNHPGTLWKDGVVPAGAGSNCAQPGAAVNDYKYGAWCFCKEAAVEAPLPPSWDRIDNGLCEVEAKQFGSSAPKGFAYDTAGARANALYYPGKVTVSQCQDLCSGNLTNCVFVGYDAAAQRCYFAEWCTTFNRTESGFVTYHNGAQPVPPAPTSHQSAYGYCTSPLGVPEQINIQIASTDSVVLSFVTFESAAPAGNPTAVVNGTTYTGVTHVHVSVGGDRTYYMHFVQVSGLKSRQTYSYTVVSGAAGATRSPAYTFRAPYPEGETRVNIYGDMGIYTWNNLEWLERDCRSGDADLIVHMGDHAYNEGDEDERRADGYMNGFQPVLSGCSWLPNVGNHEFYDGVKLARYLDQTWQKWGPLPSLETPKELRGHATATSALGYLLAAGNHHGAGLQSSVPSDTSRYFSVDLGMMHLVALNMNGYFGVDSCGDTCIKAQLEWLKKDLALANQNRAKQPWVVAFAHFPLYCTGCLTKSAFYESAAAEKYGNANKTAATAWGKTPEGMRRLREQGFGQGLRNTATVVNDFEPIFQEYGVDIFLAGHWHYYESLFPAAPGPDSCRSCANPVQKDFNAPNVTVHVTTGNGGPPGIDTFTEDCPSPDCGKIPATRFQSTEFGYGRIIAHNVTHLTYQQFNNKDGKLADEWTIYQPTHGPFPKML